MWGSGVKVKTSQRALASGTDSGANARRLIRERDVWGRRSSRVSRRWFRGFNRHLFFLLSLLALLFPFFYALFILL